MAQKNLLTICIFIFLPLSCAAQAYLDFTAIPAGNWYDVTTADFGGSLEPGADFPTPTFTMPDGVREYRYRVRQTGGASWRVLVSRTISPPWDLNVPLELAQRNILDYITLTGTDQLFMSGTGNLANTRLILRVSLSAQHLVAGTMSTTLTYTLMMP